MFPSAEGPTANKKWRRFNKKMIIITSGAIAIAVCLVVTVMVLDFGGSPVTVSQSVTQKIAFPIYLPKELPGSFKVEEKSFRVVEDNSVLVFEATDGVSQLAFSEQARPRDFSFEEFYKTQFKNTKILGNVPYPSVRAKSADGRIALSIVTTDVWILMVTSATLDDSDLARIAANLYKP